jgi:hypothetical protein
MEIIAQGASRGVWPRPASGEQRMIRGALERTGRYLLGAAVVAIGIGAAVTPQPARALSPGEGVAIGLGALAVGTAVGAASNPYYYGYPGYYPYAPAYYYPPAPAYYPPPRSCWSPYYYRYIPC